MWMLVMIGRVDAHVLSGVVALLVELIPIAGKILKTISFSPPMTVLIISPLSCPCVS